MTAAIKFYEICGIQFGDSFSILFSQLTCNVRQAFMSCPMVKTYQSFVKRCNLF